MLVLVVLVLVPIGLGRDTASVLPRHSSLGKGRDKPLQALHAHAQKCIEPPPPITQLTTARAGGQAAAAAAVAAAPPPNHLKYLGLDGIEPAGDTKGWANLAYLPLLGLEGEGPGVNETLMEEGLANGYDLMLNVAGITVVQCEWTTNNDVARVVAGAPASRFKRRSGADAPPHCNNSAGGVCHCADKWRQAWFGNATVGGVWNTTVKRLADEKKIIGVYVGDELLGGEITISNLSAIFDYIKQGDESLITYYNEEWAPINDPAWRDSVGEPLGQLPVSLDWISYDFYRLNNVSWLQPMCEYPQNLYPRMAPHQRAVLIPGGWGSTSGPRGGAAQFKLNCAECYHCKPPGCPKCDPIVDMSCTSDPVSCSNLPSVEPGGSSNGTLNGLAWEADMVLTELVNDGNRPSICWKMEDYDAFNVENALGYYHWAVADPRVVAINIWPWAGFLPVASYPGVNVGLKMYPNASAAWATIGREITKTVAARH